MPLVQPEYNADTGLFERLESAGAVVIDQAAAEHQDIRPARIGLLNLMPAPVMEATELRWLTFMSHTVLQIEPVLIKFNDDPREHATSSRRPILERYQKFSEVADIGLDALIVTGDNQEIRCDSSPQPLDELFYANDLANVMDWADQEVGSAIYSCLASHFALSHRYGAKREIQTEKTFGVYPHEIVERSPIVAAMDDLMWSPHSRWGNIAENELADTEVTILATNPHTGWLLAEAPTSAGGTSTYLQGHPEYWRNDLHNEYMRDQKSIPENYYPENNPENRPFLSWSDGARALFSNWINQIYTNYSLS